MALAKLGSSLITIYITNHVDLNIGFEYLLWIVTLLHFSVFITFIHI